MQPRVGGWLSRSTRRHRSGSCSVAALRAAEASIHPADPQPLGVLRLATVSGADHGCGSPATERASVVSRESR